MGKKGGGSAPESPDPYETAQAESQLNRFDTYSPSGAGVRYGYTDPETGQFVQGVNPGDAQAAVQTVESDWERQIRQALEPASLSLTDRIITDNIDGMPDAARVGDRGTVADSIFQRTYSMMEPVLDRQNTRTLNNLQNRGIPIGSEAFNEVMADQQRQTGDTLSRLAMDADINAGQEQSRQFGLDAAQRSNAISEIVAAMGGNYNPPSSVPGGGGAGVNLSGLVNQNYQNEMAAYQQQQQQRAQSASTIGSIAGSMLLKSDRRLKRDIRRVGTRGQFTLYEYRYIWDRPGVRRRGYMAQEVLRVLPAAVHRLGRWLALDYSMLPEV